MTRSLKSVPDRSKSHLRSLVRALDVTTLVGLISGILAALGAAVIATMVADSDPFTTKQERHLEKAVVLIESQRNEIRRLLRGTEALSRESERTARKLRQLEASIEAGQVAGDSGELGRELAATREALADAAVRASQVEERITQFNQRLAKLENIILDDPEKAVALPLLRRDIKALEQQSGRDMESMRAENARVYDLMKWLVGLMALVSLSLIGTAAGNVFKREAAKEAAKGPLQGTLNQGEKPSTEAIPTPQRESSAQPQR